jgi:hypothetical protein
MKFLFFEAVPLGDGVNDREVVAGLLLSPALAGLGHLREVVVSAAYLVAGGGSLIETDAAWAAP